MPAFVACLDFTSGRKLTSAALLHIGPNNVELILQAVRRAEEAGQTELHNIKIALPLGDAHAIASNGGNLRDAWERAPELDAGVHLLRLIRHRELSLSFTPALVPSLPR